MKFLLAYRTTPQVSTGVTPAYLVFGRELKTSPPLWPQANGEVERQNRTLLKILKVVHMEGKGWK